MNKIVLLSCLALKHLAFTSVIQEKYILLLLKTPLVF